MLRLDSLQRLSIILAGGSATSEPNISEEVMNKRFVSVFACLALVFSILITDRTQAWAQKRKFKHDSKIETIYQPANDRTVVRTRFKIQPEKAEDFRTALLMAGFYFAGKTLTGPPQEVEIYLLSSSKRGELFAKDRSVTMILDQRPLMLGEGELLKGAFSSFSTEPVEPFEEIRDETLLIRMPYANFLEVVAARKVVLLAASNKFKFSEDNLEALRDLASRMAP
jgi:hypothetical protein